MDFRGLIWKPVWKITLFGLKQGQDLENRAAHPHQEFMLRINFWLGTIHFFSRGWSLLYPKLIEIAFSTPPPPKENKKKKESLREGERTNCYTFWMAISREQTSGISWCCKNKKTRSERNFGNFKKWQTYKIFTALDGTPSEDGHVVFNWFVNIMAHKFCILVG